LRELNTLGKFLEDQDTALFGLKSRHDVSKFICPLDFHLVKCLWAAPSAYCQRQIIFLNKQMLTVSRRSAGYLSTANETSFTKGAVTVIGTGNTPLDLVEPITDRYYFWDAPIPILNSTLSNITSFVSPVASTDFYANFGPVLGTSLNETQVELLREQVKTLHDKGIKLRYWNQPEWPISTRNGIWRQLRTEGVDFINADDVVAAAGIGYDW
jgi:hypothetical protein